MKYHVLEISHAPWGYVTDMSDWSGGRAVKKGQTPDGKHTLRAGLDNTLVPGMPDKEVLGYMPSGYGFVRPWDTEGISDDEKEVQTQWGFGLVKEFDYYVSLLNGCPDPEAVRLYYPERVFVSGKDESGEGRDLTRAELLGHLHKVGFRGNACYWNPVQIYCGIHSGFPHFVPGLRAHTDLGGSWFEASQKLSGKLPAGYDWNMMGQAPAAEQGYGLLTFEEEDTE